jgi:hypothetical protein
MNPTLMRTHRPPCRFRRFDHWMVCQHQVEIEVWPASAEVYFHDERYADPVNTQVRFDAAVYNAPNCEVKWEVRALDGSPGQGQVDSTGLYTAPDKDGLNSGLTQIVVATAVADPKRQAFAYVTLVGRGPEPPPVATVLILPQRVNLYYRLGGDSAWIDDSNKVQVFRAVVQNSPSNLNWFVGASAVPEAEHGPLFYFSPAAASGSDTFIPIRAQLATDATVKSEAKVVLVNYTWPGIV